MADAETDQGALSSARERYYHLLSMTLSERDKERVMKKRIRP
jgi:hypothetical protein